MRLWQVVHDVPDRARAAIGGMPLELSFHVIRRNIGFADDPLQEAVVASAIGEASDPSRLAHPIFRIPMRLDMHDADHVVAGHIREIMVRQVVAAVVVLVNIVLSEPVDMGVDNALGLPCAMNRSSGASR
jgi:hypothetical protein